MLFMLDIPFVFFSLVFLLTTVKLKEKEFNSIVASIIYFLSLLLFGVIIFFHLAYPDLI
jgi:hypothetical protein